MSNLKFLLPFLLLSFMSCEVDNYDLDHGELTETSVDLRGEFNQDGCILVTSTGRNEDFCCTFDVCYKGSLIGATYDLEGGEETLTFTPEQSCFSITVCDATELTLIKTDEFYSKILCTRQLNCSTMEECCESICFNYEIVEENKTCTTFKVTLDGDSECYPYGVRVNGGLGFTGGAGYGTPSGANIAALSIIELNNFSGNNGTVNQILTFENEFVFEYCGNELFKEYYFQFTINNNLCDNMQTFNFDLFSDGPYENQCN